MALKIIWNAGGEDTSDSKYTWYNKHGKAYELPIPIKEGYEFGGWYNYDPNYPGTLEKMDFIHAEDVRRLRLYALWKKDGVIADCYDDITPDYFINIREPKTTFSVRISYYCASPLTEEMHELGRFNVGEEITLPIPVREGYVFGGWYQYNKRKENPQASKIVNIPKDSKKRTYRLYAKWIDEEGNIDDCYGLPKPIDFVKADKRYEKYISSLSKKDDIASK